MRNLTSRGGRFYTHWICPQCQADAYLRTPIKNYLRNRDKPICCYCGGTMELKKPEQNLYYQEQQKLAIRELEKVRRHVLKIEATDSSPKINELQIQILQQIKELEHGNHS